MIQMEAVRGLAGKYHASRDNMWFDRSKRLTLCNKGISPNYVEDDLSKVECERCKEELARIEALEAIIAFVGHPVEEACYLTETPAKQLIPKQTIKSYYKSLRKS